MTEKITLAKYRIEVAEEKLDSSKVLDSPKHSGIISLFNQHFVKENIVDKSLGKLLAEAKDAREESDYGDFIIVSPQEADTQLRNAELFVKEIKQTINKLK